MIGNQAQYKIDELYAILDDLQLALPGCIEVHDLDSPYLFVYLPDDNSAITVCSRSFIMKKIMRYWVTVPDIAAWEVAIARKYENIDENQCTQDILFNRLQSFIHSRFTQSSTLRFKLEIHRHGVGKGFTKEGFEQLVDRLIYTLKAACECAGAATTSAPWAGQVDLVNPVLVLCFWEGLSSVHSSAATTLVALPGECSSDLVKERRDDTCTAPNTKEIHVGRLIFDNSKKSSKIVDTFHLRKGRPFLGPTSMDCELAFIMCTLAGCSKGKIVLDPFVGSASILVSATRLGALCVGCDIDMRILSGKGIDKTSRSTIADNFLHYGLTPPDILCSSQNCRAWRRGQQGSGMEGYFDAIVTDPPYGVRAGARKISSAVSSSRLINFDGESGRKEKGSSPQLSVECERDIAEETMKGKKNKRPASVPYSTVECLDDLLDLAAEVLVMGGKLVFFVPSSSSIFPSTPSVSTSSSSEGIESQNMAERYMSHPCLERVSFSEDTSSVGRGKSVLRRHLLVLRKVAPWAGSSMVSNLARQRAKRNNDDRDIDICVRDIGASVYKDSRRKVTM